MYERLKKLAGLSMALGLGTAGCGGDDEKGPPDGFTEQEWEVVSGLSPLPEPPLDPTNKYESDDRAVTLGVKLFYDARYSGPLGNFTSAEGALGAAGETGKVSCASCHDATHAFSDTRSTPNNLSIAAGRTARNAPPLTNLAYYTWFTWAGKRDSLWGQAAVAPEAGTDVNADRCRIARHLYANYKDEYNALFTEHPLPEQLAAGHPDGARFPDKCKPKANAAAADGPWETQMTAEDKKAILRIMANYGKAVGAWERRLVSGNSAFDKYVAGDGAAMSAEAKRGLKLFIGKAFCVQCHSGPAFQDGQFHNDAVAQEGVNVPTADKESGRFGDIGLLSYPFRTDGEYSDDPVAGAKKYEGVTQSEETKGLFRTKGLRNVGLTGPYFHNGSAATLADVVEHYNQGGDASGFQGTKSDKLQPLNLTDGEKADLVAFLEALTGEQVPDELAYPPSP